MAQDRISFTYTILIWTGILIAISGIIIFILGIGGLTEIIVNILGIELRTNQVGIAILVIGAALADSVALKIPKETRVLEERKRNHTLTERISRKIPFFAFLILIGAIYYFLPYELKNDLYKALKTMFTK